MQIEIYMKGNSLMIKSMDMVFTHIQMELKMKDIGKKINKKEEEMKNGPMLPVMRENIKKEKNQVFENLNGLMVVLMKVILKIIILMIKLPIFGEIKGNMWEIGKIIKWMGMSFLHGLMEEDMKENIIMIRRMDMKYLNWLMEKNIKCNGKMENKMEKLNFIMIKTIVGQNTLFEMEKELNGQKNLLDSHRKAKFTKFI